METLANPRAGGRPNPTDKRVIALAALPIGLFRAIGDLAYVPIASSGNLMRVVESGYGGIVDKIGSSRRAAAVYASLNVAKSSPNGASAATMRESGRVSVPRRAIRRCGVFAGWRRSRPTTPPRGAA
jgi:hypothetical protein